MAKRLDRQLTDVELELMQLVWGLGECTIRDVHEALPKGRDLAYTTVATMIKILEQKGAVSCHKKDRAITVRPRIERSDYETASLKHLNEMVFQGNATSMVTRLLDETELTVEELRALRKLLDEGCVHDQPLYTNQPSLSGCMDRAPTVAKKEHAVSRGKEDRSDPVDHQFAHFQSFVVPVLTWLQNLSSSLF